MNIPEEVKREIMVTFQAELAEHLQALNSGMLKLEKGMSEEACRQLLIELFRTAHNLKGSARAVGLRTIVMIADRLEDLLGALQRKEISPGSGLFEVMFRAVDTVEEEMAFNLKGKKLPSDRRDILLNEMKKALKGEKGAEGKGPAERRSRREGKVMDVEEASKPAIPIPQSRPSGPEALRAGSGEVGPSPPVWKPPGPKAEPEAAIRNPQLQEDTIRVTTKKLDDLMDGMGELLVARMSKEQRFGELQALQVQMENWRKSWRKIWPHYSFLLRQSGHEPNIAAMLDFLTQNEEQIDSMSDDIDDLLGSFSRDHNRLALLTDELQERVRSVRMLPISNLFDIFPRMVRDLARERDKEITLRIEGADAEVDRHIMEAMKDPLTHLLRNAVDHGIEPPEKRYELGKPREGVIHIRAVQRGNTLILKVSDDGNGIDLEKVRQSAVKRGLLTKREASALSKHEGLELIFRSGFSTEARATDLSGRGVGLDVVRESLEKLHALIHVKTDEGHGTTFTMTLPLTLVTNQVLLVEVGNEIMAIPTTSVERIQRVKNAEVRNIEGKPAINVGGGALRLLSLARVLGIEHREKLPALEQIIPAVILGAAEKRIAFRVDGFQGTQEVVIKPIGRQLRRVPNVAGATILGNGQVVMILNASDLLKSSQAKSPDLRRPSPEAKRPIRRRVLVVDDSITTRTLEKSILENAGCHVFIAADGEEGLAIVQSEPLDAVVADVAMPRMDGFELTERIKGDEQFKNLPVILVTSLESRQDKIRGLEAGADAYITKQTFDQQELLETIERLIG